MPAKKTTSPTSDTPFKSPASAKVILTNKYKFKPGAYSKDNMYSKAVLANICKSLGFDDSGSHKDMTKHLVNHFLDKGEEIFFDSEGKVVGKRIPLAYEDA